MVKNCCPTTDEIMNSHFPDLIGKGIILTCSSFRGTYTIGDTVQLGWYPSFSYKELIGIYKHGGHNRREMFSDLFDIKCEFSGAEATGVKLPFFKPAETK